MPGGPRGRGRGERNEGFEGSLCKCAQYVSFILIYTMPVKNENAHVAGTKFKTKNGNFFG